jgi:ABC-type sugar transport system ATPase subunit
MAQLVINLSGGNQQKVVLAMAFAGSEVLLRRAHCGRGRGRKAEIYRMMESLRQGKSSL